MLHNPVETTGVKWGKSKIDEYRICSEIVLKDASIDILILPVSSGIIPRDFQDMVIDLKKRAGNKPIIVIWIAPFDQPTEDMARKLISTGIPVYGEPASAAKALSFAYRYSTEKN